VCADPKYEEEVSGCTASVGLITSTQIFVVSCKRDCFSNTANIHRRTLVILDLYLVSKAERNHCLSITSLKMKVRHNESALSNASLTSGKAKRHEYVLPVVSLILVE